MALPQKSSGRDRSESLGGGNDRFCTLAERPSRLHRDAAELRVRCHLVDPAALHEHAFCLGNRPSCPHRLTKPAREAFVGHVRARLGEEDGHGTCELGGNLLVSPRECDGGARIEVERPDESLTRQQW